MWILYIFAIVNKHIILKIKRKNMSALSASVNFYDAVNVRCEKERRMCMNKTMNLQDVFLNQCRKEKIAVTIFLTNGFQFKGVVKGFDSYVVILDCEGKQQLVYKHAISTIVPAKAISILDASEKTE